MTTLILGGARSGKSQLAQRLAEPYRSVCYIATCAPGNDAEMLDRVRRHRAARPEHWRTVEEPLAIDAAVESACADSEAVLVDCLTVWLANLLDAHRDLDVDAVEEAATGQLERIVTLGRSRAVILVSNEVGCGIVPETPVGRAFRDVQGRVNQYAASAADGVALVVAGLPLWLKGGPR